MTIHELYMHRCLELAKLGAGYVAPNPMVGAILVHDDRIIGEGYHQRYGEAHAEPNCIGAVKKDDQHLISQSVMYVSLEPCVHFGKTPPCADLIIKNKIPKVIIGCRDPFEKVNGRGIEKLREAAIDVEQGISEKSSKELNKRFFTFHTKHRPYIILKWAQTANGFIATSPQTPLQRRGGFENPGGNRLLISNEFTNRLVHKWRSEEAAILVGTNTASMDDPQLTTRLWPGKNPIRLVVDMNLKLPSALKIFNREAKTIVFNKIKHQEEDTLVFYQVTDDVSLVHQVSNALYQLNIQSVIVEGGLQLLQSFIDEGLWDEARIINNEELIINNGLAAPALSNYTIAYNQKIFTDAILICKPTS